VEHPLVQPHVARMQGTIDWVEWLNKSMLKLQTSQGGPHRLSKAVTALQAPGGAVGYNHQLFVDPPAVSCCCHVVSALHTGNACLRPLNMQ